MSVVQRRERRSTAGRRMTELTGKAMEEDDTFWGHETWNDDEDNESFHSSDEDSEVKKDVFDSDFDESESDHDEEEAAAGDEEDRALAKSERKQKAAAKSTYTDTFGGGKGGKKIRGVKRVLGDGLNAGIVLNAPGRLVGSVAPVLPTKAPPSTPSRPSARSEPRTTAAATRPRRATKLNKYSSRVRSTRSETMANTALAPPSTQSSSSSAALSKKKKRQRFSQEELLLEAANVTEGENTRWLLARKRTQDQQKDDEIKMENRGRKSVGKLIERFNSRRGYLNTITFPEMDHVPSILTRTTADRVDSSEFELRKQCVITGRPARYRDPRTGLGYFNLDAFKELRRRSDAGEPLDQRTPPKPVDNSSTTQKTSGDTKDSKASEGAAKASETPAKGSLGNEVPNGKRSNRLDGDAATASSTSSKKTRVSKSSKGKSTKWSNGKKKVQTDKGVLNATNSDDLLSTSETQTEAPLETSHHAASIDLVSKVDSPPDAVELTTSTVKPNKRQAPKSHKSTKCVAKKLAKISTATIENAKQSGADEEEGGANSTTGNHQQTAKNPVGSQPTSAVKSTTYPNSNKTQEKETGAPVPGTQGLELPNARSPNAVTVTDKTRKGTVQKSKDASITDKSGSRPLKSEAKASLQLEQRISGASSELRLKQQIESQLATPVSGLGHGKARPWQSSPASLADSKSKASKSPVGLLENETQRLPSQKAFLAPSCQQYFNTHTQAELPGVMPAYYPATAFNVNPFSGVFWQFGSNFQFVGDRFSNQRQERQLVSVPVNASSPANQVNVQRNRSSKTTQSTTQPSESKTRDIPSSANQMGTQQQMQSPGRKPKAVAGRTEPNVTRSPEKNAHSTSQKPNGLVEQAESKAANAPTQVAAMKHENEHQLNQTDSVAAITSDASDTPMSPPVTLVGERSQSSDNKQKISVHQSEQTIASSPVTVLDSADGQLPIQQAKDPMNVTASRAVTSVPTLAASRQGCSDKLVKQAGDEVVDSSALVTSNPKNAKRLPPRAKAEVANSCADEKQADTDKIVSAGSEARAPASLPKASSVADETGLTQSNRLASPRKRKLAETIQENGESAPQSVSMQGASTPAVPISPTELKARRTVKLDD